MNDRPASRRWLIWTLRIVVLVLVGFGVSGTVQNAVEQLSKHEWQMHPTWVVAAGALYAVGLVPMAWFWRRALLTAGFEPPFAATLRAYYLGHLGKYVPGKALAVILRVAAVQHWVPSIRVAIACALLETLTMMAVGAALAAAFSLFVLRLEPTVTLLAVGLALVIGVPTLPPVARFLANIGAQRAAQSADNDETIELPPRAFERYNFGLLAQGWLAATLCWLLLGASLWATLRAIGVTSLEPIADLPLLITVVSFSVVAGFASMLPGGFVVRDALLMQLLTPSCGPANALIAAVLMRLIWLVSEVAVCVILYVAAKVR